MSARYKCSTLAEIRLIPLEARERFLAELPRLLASLDEITIAAPTLAAKMRAAAPWPWRLLPMSFFVAAAKSAGQRNMVWVDDDKETVTVSMKVSAEGAAFYSQTESLP
jgi:hypothetical protein